MLEEKESRRPDAEHFDCAQCKLAEVSKRKDSHGNTEKMQKGGRKIVLDVGTVSRPCCFFAEKRFATENTEGTEKTVGVVS